MMQFSQRKRQRGVVLIVGLIFLLLMALLATTISETNILQLKMASNDESKMEVTQRALAIVDAILEKGTNVPVVGDVGYRVCDQDTSVATVGCDEHEIILPTEVIPTGATVDYYVDRAGPLTSPAPYLDESIAIGGGASVAVQKIHVTVDRSADDRGAVELVQGYLRLIINTQTIVDGTLIVN